MKTIKKQHLGMLLSVTLLAGCLGGEPEGLALAEKTPTTVKFDFYHKPLPEIPLPNDIATRHDPTSATGLRINASMAAPTTFEARVRQLIDSLDGWGIYQAITIPFTAAIDVNSITKAHRDVDYKLDDDVIYLVNVDRDSAEFGRIHHIDLGEGNFPVVLESRNKYWKNDPRGDTLSILFEEVDEDINKNGVLDPGEDTDADGRLDKPNYLPGRTPAATDMAGRADALMGFYEAETNTVIARPLMPLRERTTYAVIVTRRLLDARGNPVGSPFEYINHTAQNEALAHLPEVLPGGVSLDDIAFVFSFTTQSVKSQMQAVRNGLYGQGVQAHLGQNFPGEVADLKRLWDKDSKDFKDMQTPHILYTEQLLAAFEDIAVQLLGQKKGTEAYTKLMESQRYVDYHVVGMFKTPRLWKRWTDEVPKSGASSQTTAPPTGTTRKMVPYNDQAWPPDLDRVPAPAYEEPVYFWLTVPRKEVSARKDGKPAPVVILGHGYGGNRTDVLSNSGYMAKHGLATLAIDCVSHGLALSKAETVLAETLLGIRGMKAFMQAVLTDRAFDHNNDEVKDSGADFWSSYVFHTRDMVRQSNLDYMQLVRVLRGFDGTRKWSFDTDKDGKPDVDGLAGDFDGDGKVDVGGSGALNMTGGSLGGIMAMTVGGTEPEMQAVVPIAGGAGLGDVGVRSRQGGVPEAFILRVMGPLITGTLDSKTNETKLEMIVPDLNRARELHFASTTGLTTGDTVVVRNLNNKAIGCGYVSKTGTFRVSVESDTGDLLELSFYSGDVLAGTECKLKGGVKPTKTISTFEKLTTFQGKNYEVNSKLVAVTEGMGRRRATPGLRQFMSFASFVVEPGDPVAYMRHMLDEPLTYEVGPQKTVQTGTHALIVTTVGDMNVPASSGVTAGRTAGLIEYLKPDKAQGKSQNQVLLDSYMTEAVDNIKRYTHKTKSHGVHLDVDNFSLGTDRFGTNVPRLTTPLRAGLDKTDRLGGKSGAIFPYSSDTGSHGFDPPGKGTDRFRSQCKAECTKTGGTDPCGCEKATTFDVGSFMYNIMGQYFANGGKTLDTGLCNSSDTCPYIKAIPLPKVRNKSTLK